MLVRSLRTHYFDGYHKEGEEFEFAGPLYRHITPVDPAKAEKAAAEQEQAAKAEKPAPVHDKDVAKKS